MKIWSLVIALIFICSIGLFIAPGIAESRITAVYTNTGYSLALNDNGTVWVWGTATSSYSGNGVQPFGLHPIIMPGIDRAVAIAGYGQYPVVLKDDGTVWLLANYPDLENASLLASDTYKEPIQVPGLDNIVAIAGVGGNLLMLSKNGTVWEMADINQFGILGTAVPYFDGSYNVTIPNLTNDSSYNETIMQYYYMHPVQVAGLSDIKAVAVGDGHELALKSDGTVWSWGQNEVGERGDGTFIQHPNYGANGNPVPGMVKGLANVTSISAGYLFSVALENNGTVWTWGWNMYGELGDGIPGNVEVNRTTPVRVVGLTNVTDISSGRDYTLALKDDGTVWTWGEYDGYQLIDNEPPYYYIPTQVKNLSGIESISANQMNSMALDKTGVIWAWGDNEYGQLGDGKNGVDLYQYTPEPVPFSKALAGQAVEPSAPVSPSVQAIPTSTPTPDNNDIEYIAAVNDTIYSFTMHGLTAMDTKGARNGTFPYPASGHIVPGRSCRSGRTIAASTWARCSSRCPYLLPITATSIYIQ